MCPQSPGSIEAVVELSRELGKSEKVESYRQASQSFHSSMDGSAATTSASNQASRPVLLWEIKVYAKSKFKKKPCPPSAVRPKVKPKQLVIFPVNYANKLLNYEAHKEIICPFDLFVLSYILYCILSGSVSRPGAIVK
ncbi:unnamed protein product [Protopolystoma xenopodis]|uniref:Uncharacterized protein n=1 Tax=Protopolystoma xenopodis TaxID=117903 RepID=A0A3S5CJP0_9PLAT|nr:unnamed protein product [Protopolystoma xenopodis]